MNTRHMMCQGRKNYNHFLFLQRNQMENVLSSSCNSISLTWWTFSILGENWTKTKSLWFKSSKRGVITSYSPLLITSFSYSDSPWRENLSSSSLLLVSIIFFWLRVYFIKEGDFWFFFVIPAMILASIRGEANMFLKGRLEKFYFAACPRFQVIILLM